MPEIQDVVGGTPIEADWGNPIRDRTVQRYASAAARTSSDPSPEAGQVSYVADRGVIEYFHGAAWRPMFPPGIIMDFAGTNAPTGFLICQGQAVSRTTFAALFAAIGTDYGSGDGETTFNVPNLRGRYTMGVAASGTGSTLGDTFGSVNHTHTGPSHTHPNPATGGAPNHQHTMTAGTTAGGGHAHTVGPSTSAGGHAHTTDSAGGHGHTTSDASAGTGRASGTSFVAAITHTHTVNSAGSHSHSTSTTGAHTHPNPDTGTVGNHAHGVNTSDGAGSHTHNQGNTEAGGTGNTGSNNPPTMALNKIISI